MSIFCQWFYSLFSPADFSLTWLWVWDLQSLPFKYVVLLWWDGGDWKSRTTLVLESYRRPCSSWLGGPTGWNLAKPVELPIFNVNVNRLKHYHERVLKLVIPLPNDRWKSIVNFMLRNVFFACLFFTSVCTYIQTTHWFFFLISHCFSLNIWYIWSFHFWASKSDETLSNALEGTIFYKKKFHAFKLFPSSKLQIYLCLFIFPPVWAISFLQIARWLTVFRMRGFFCPPFFSLLQVTHNSHIHVHYTSLTSWETVGNSLEGFWHFFLILYTWK